MTVNEIAAELGVNRQIVTTVAKKINQYCFRRGITKQFNDREIREIKKMVIMRQNRVPRSRIAKEIGLTQIQAFRVSMQMGLDCTNRKGAYLSPDIVEEWKAVAREYKKKLELEKKTKTKKSKIPDSVYFEIHNRIVREGYITNTDLQKIMTTHLKPVILRFEKLDIQIYDDKIKINGKLEKVFKSQKALFGKWREEAKYLPKNGCMGPVGLNL